MRIAVLGPTASGKSALGVEIARRIGGTVVNGDPFQAVAGLAIGTGQPGPAEQGGVPHLGYGALGLEAPLNPADFGALARTWLEAQARAVLVTGSGLYLRGIWDQLDELPPVPPGIVARVRRGLERFGAPRLHRRLAQVDPARAAELHPNDGSRIQRALALHLATGRRPSELLSGAVRAVPGSWKALLVLPGRERQRERVAARVHAMIEQGWPGEVQRVVEGGGEAHLRRLRPLGYLDWLGGDDPAVIEARIVRDTAAYAKRQATWFRNQLPGLPIWDPDTQEVEEAFRLLGI